MHDMCWMDASELMIMTKIDITFFLFTTIIIIYIYIILLYFQKMIKKWVFSENHISDMQSTSWFVIHQIPFASIVNYVAECFIVQTLPFWWIMCLTDPVTHTGQDKDGLTNPVPTVLDDQANTTTGVDNLSSPKTTIQFGKCRVRQSSRSKATNWLVKTSMDMLWMVGQIDNWCVNCSIWKNKWGLASMIMPDDSIISFILFANQNHYLNHNIQSTGK